MTANRLQFDVCDGAQQSSPRPENDFGVPTMLVIKNSQ